VDSGDRGKPTIIDVLAAIHSDRRLISPVRIPAQ
jgi:hypothetical protein